MQSRANPRRRAATRPRSVKDLPFVADVLRPGGLIERRLWVVPPTKNYREARRIGAQYAADYLKWVRRDHVAAILLPMILQDMQVAEASGTATRGYGAGFLAFLVCYIAETAGDIDIAGMHSRFQVQCDAMMPPRDRRSSGEVR